MTTGSPDSLGSLSPSPSSSLSPSFSPSSFDLFLRSAA